MKILLLFISITSFCQLREPEQQIIFFERVSNNNLNIPKEGKILVFTDSLQAFDLTWNIDTILLHETDGGDKLLKAVYHISHKGQKATLLVINRRLSFMMNGLQDVEMIQLPHQCSKNR